MGIAHRLHYDAVGANDGEAQPLTCCTHRGVHLDELARRHAHHVDFGIVRQQVPLDRGLGGPRCEEDALDGGRRILAFSLPREPCCSHAAVLVVLHLERYVPLQVNRAGAGCEGLVAPVVYQQVLVYPQAHAVVGGGRETVGARLKVGRAHPAHREAVTRHTQQRRARSPIEVDLRILPDDDAAVRGWAGWHTTGTQRGIGIVLGPPGPGCQTCGFPGQLGFGQAGILVIFHHDQVMPRRQADVAGVGGRRLVLPGINQQMAVHIQTNSVVHGHAEPIVARGHVNVARPARREVVGLDLEVGGPEAPVVVQIALLALNHWRAPE